MKFKLLLFGGNNTSITDFFRQMSKDFELLSSSQHEEDILGHLKYFTPDAMIYCLRRESGENISKISEIHMNSAYSKIPLIAFGDPEDTDAFRKAAPDLAELVLSTPLTASMIVSRVSNFLNSAKAQAAYDQAMSGDLLSVLTGAKPGGGSEDNGQKRVLIVDDDIRMVKVVKSFVETKYQVATAVSGNVALRFLANKKVDLILLDYEMPDMSGPDVLERIRKQKNIANTPVIFLTGVSEREKLRRAVALKPQGYILKPVDKDKLMAKIDEVLNHG